MVNYDITRTGEENVFLLLAGSAKDGVVISEADISFGAVTADSSVSGANSKITISPVKGSAVVNDKSEPLDRHYNRLDLATVITALGIDIDAEAKLTAEQDDNAKKAAFIGATGIALEATDLTISVADSKATFTMVATHHGLIGSVEVAVAPAVLPFLEEVLDEPILKGFTDPEAKG